VLVAAGKGAEADTFSATWLKEHPKDRGYRLNLAQEALGKKDYAAAVRQYKVLIEQEPGDALALNNLAWVSGALKDPKALEYAERADKLAPGSPQILDTLGTLQVEKGDTARGVDSLRKAVALAPDESNIPPTSLARWSRPAKRMRPRRNWRLSPSWVTSSPSRRKSRS
jgi:tetratricopeptide (TPR) repeat protein